MNEHLICSRRTFKSSCRSVIVYLPFCPGWHVKINGWTDKEQSTREAKEKDAAAIEQAM